MYESSAAYVPVDDRISLLAVFYINFMIRTESHVMFSQFTVRYYEPSYLA